MSLVVCGYSTFIIPTTSDNSQSNYETTALCMKRYLKPYPWNVLCEVTRDKISLKHPTHYVYIVPRTKMYIHHFKNVNIADKKTKQYLTTNIQPIFNSFFNCQWQLVSLIKYQGDNNKSQLKQICYLHPRYVSIKLNLIE